MALLRYFEKVQILALKMTIFQKYGVAMAVRIEQL
jgi:hypothetical protein